MQVTALICAMNNARRAHDGDIAVPERHGAVSFGFVFMTRGSWRKTGLNVVWVDVIRRVEE